MSKKTIPNSAMKIAPGAFDSSFSPSLAGVAAGKAANVLLENWRNALAVENSENLAGDVERLISELRAFEVFALQHLPIQNGGLQGKPAQYWLDLLDPLGISVYEAEDLPGHFGYTGCDADDYMSLDEALVAAVAANIDYSEEALSAESPRG